MNDRQVFMIVTFPNENDCVAVVPESWLIGKNVCCWPTNENSKQVSKLAQKEAAPETTWAIHPIRLLSKKSLHLNVLKCLQLSY